MNDIVLVSLRDFQDDVCDIIDNYDENGARKLKETKELGNHLILVKKILLMKVFRY